MDLFMTPPSSHSKSRIYMTSQHMDSPITMNLLLVCARDISDTALIKDVLLLQRFELINIVLYPFKVFRVFVLHQ